MNATVGSLKVISFALWGNRPKYCDGAIKNVKLAATFFPDWTCRFYCDAVVPPECLAELRRADRVEVIQSDIVADWGFLTRRFLPMSEPDVEVMISRDTDSRLSEREQHAVQAWLDSRRAAHIMRDHPQHGGYPIMGGMFGVRRHVVNDVTGLLKLMEGEPAYNYDQSFLAHHIWPIIKNDCLVHDEFFDKIPFPTERRNWEFVGQVFDENDQPVESQVEFLKHVLAMRKLGL